MGFYDIAGSTFLYVCVIIGILYVVGVSIFYLRKCYAQGLEQGVSKKMLGDIVKASITTSIVPSIGIVVGLFSLAAMLGIPWPWFRLSVIGSVTYEIMAANMALKALGLEGVELAGVLPRAFGLIMFVMTIGIMGSHLVDLFLVKKVHMGTVNLKNRDRKWGSVSGTVFITALLVVFVVPMVFGSLASVATLITSALLATLLAVIIKATKATWLNNFVLAFSLLGAMCMSVLWDRLFA